MKKIISICTILTIFTFTSGFVKNDTIIDINKNKINIEMTNLISDELGSEYVESITNINNYGRDGLKIESKKDNGYSGIYGKKEYNIEDVTTNKLSTLEISNFLNKDFNDKSLIEVEKGFFKNRYKIQYTFDKSSLKELENIYNSNVELNLTNIDNYNEYIKCTNGTVITETEKTNCTLVVETYNNKKKEYEDIAKKLKEESSYTVTINLPVKSLESNETLKSNDGKKLTWTLTNEGVNDINCTFEITNLTNIILVGGSSLLLAIIIILILIMINKKKKKEVETNNESEPIHTDYDPSIASEIDAMGGFINRGNEEIPQVDMTKQNEDIMPNNYEYTLPEEVPNVIKEETIEKAPKFITSENTKEDEIVIKEAKEEVKLITPEVTDIK